jgi:HK97 family phage prohead protease
MKIITKESEIKAVKDKGIVQMYVNAFDNEDSDGDISMKGSFAKTIQENLKRIRHFLNHDITKLLGAPIEMKEDDFGLLVTSQMNMNKEIARDAFEDYKLYQELGRSLEHSVAVEAIKRDEKDNRYVKEWRLWEYSTLTMWGANARTPLVSMKSDMKEVIDEMLKRDYSEQRKNLLKSISETLEGKPLESTTEEPLIKELQRTVELLNQ